MNTSIELASAIRRIIGGDEIELSVRHATKECRDQIYADAVAHGGRIEDPFVNFVVIGNRAVFTFFTDPFEIYIVPCEDCSTMIREVESLGLSMGEIDEHRSILAKRYLKDTPDIVVDRDIAEHWMDMS